MNFPQIISLNPGGTRPPTPEQRAGILEALGAAPAEHEHAEYATAEQGEKADSALQPEDLPSSLPASDVAEWAKQPTKPSYTAGEVGAATQAQGEKADTSVQYASPQALTTQQKAQALANIGAATASQGAKADSAVQPGGLPTSLPASDVPAWAKQPTKPTYTPAEIGAAPAWFRADIIDQVGLATIPTMGLPVDTTVIGFVVEGGLVFHQLKDGHFTTQVGVTRPNDYHATTNTKYWAQIL